MHQFLRFGLITLGAIFAGAAALAASTRAPAADAYPVRPVRLVVPFPPGGSVDTLARTIGPKLGDALGQQIVVDNRPGGNGNIGMEIVAQARADGHTLVFASRANTAPR